MNKFWTLPRDIQEKLKDLIPASVICIPSANGRSRHKKQEIKELWDSGYTDLEIADILNISRRWVEMVLFPPRERREENRLHVLRLFKAGFSFSKIYVKTGISPLTAKGMVKEAFGSIIWRPEYRFETEER